ncbi:ABC transporter substrate-binding protein [Sedimentimonas flavescens]|uniref:ABC transporter substrate-binding protein n=1 Tax=Sedimentimonas flavescens TaxID=2851012 RepID=A0ABT3A1H1_9RHOB|nr:ABC transporter substrate-binding protein [Sedimentimonas flavescens]MBW0156501.1 ABC transporter substrate-binding protein [Sedimentimonas flavescens]MCT2538992.1 ABC transporter substrate-binding protein [Sedimentimonas flavescens]MCV2879564.1 ABC transporter substrate-binding protein [Sedimentimonas flavescens]WBL32269.1 ABC transporter substrate-binding protein [Sinirhodobacter sp. HNIBRBA609]
MKKAMMLTTALIATGFAASAQELNVVSWGGAYTVSQVEAYHKPFTEMTGVKVNSIDADNPATPLKAQVEAGNVSIDLADIELSDAIRLCDEGLLEEIDPAMLPPAPDGTPATEDFVPGAIQDCAVANIVWATVVAYDASKFPENPPSTLADFFDTEKYPGKRGLLKAAKRSLEMALVADGVPGSEVYEVLGTEEGVARALAKLDTIKDSVVWWEAGAQPPQLLADGEVVMTTGYNGRIFNAMIAENKPFNIIWDGAYMDYDLWAIPKGAPHLEDAKKFLAFSTDTQRLADQAKYISYGPARKSSSALVGMYQDGKTEMAPHMPTNPDNLTNPIWTDPTFWADHDVELSERFNAWLAN